MSAVIEAHSLCYKTGARHLLRNIDFHLNAGEHCVLFGMNGSGKTTLLSVFAGFNSQSSGSLTLFGNTPNEENILEIRKRIGFASTSFFDRFYKKETAANIVLSGIEGTFNPHAWTSSKSQTRLAELSRRLRIESVLDKPYFLLSKGEQQKVILARALISEPRLLLLDEPYSGLDILMRDELETILRQETQSRELSIIQVTHRLEEVSDNFTSAVFLRDGIVVAEGDRKSLFDENTMASFLDQSGSPLNDSVKEIATGSILDNTYDHDAECALTAGKLNDLGFMGEEISLYGIAWRDEQGSDHVAVSAKEASILNFLKQLDCKHEISSPVCYLSKRLDVPVGQKKDIEQQIAFEFANKIVADYPSAFFDSLDSIRSKITSSLEIKETLEEMRNDLRDAFDPVGVNVLEQMVNLAAERKAISDAEELLHKQWISREKKKLRETPRFSEREGNFSLSGFVYWENGIAKSVVNANQITLITKRDEKLADGFAASPIVHAEYAVEGFPEIQNARAAFKSWLVDLFELRFKKQIAAFFSDVFKKEGVRCPSSLQNANTKAQPSNLYSKRVNCYLTKWQVASLETTTKEFL